MSEPLKKSEPALKLTPSEKLEAKVDALQKKRERLLEILEKEIAGLESRLAKAKELRSKLKPGEVGPAGSQPAPLRGSAAPGPPPQLKGFRSNGRLPSINPLDPVDAMIREGKIG